MKKEILLGILILVAIFNVFAEGEIHIGYVYPAGGQRGTSFEVVVGGQNLGHVTGLFVSGKGVKGEIIEKVSTKDEKKPKPAKVKGQENEQIAQQIRLRITIDRKSDLGMRDFRLITDNGFSNRIFFEVGELPEMTEVEKNDTKETPFILPKIPVVINGQILPNDRDCFRFSALQGQTLVCETKARRLVPYMADAVPGWFQAVATLYGPDGKEVAYNDDYGPQPDPVIIYKVPQSGTYTLEIKDAIYRGREDFVYRIAIGELPFVESWFPLGGTKNKKSRISLNGVNLIKNKINVSLKNDISGRTSFTVKGKGKLSSNPVTLAENDYPEIFESPNNNSKETAQVLPGMCVVNGKIEAPGDVDWFQLERKTGDTLLFEIMSHRLGTSLDADITLFDSNMNVLEQNDDFFDRSEGLETHHADPRLIYTIKANGKYFIRVRDVQHHGGPDYAYRLIVGVPVPDFDLRIVPSNLALNKGGTTAFSVYALRKYSFNGAIQLELKGLPEGFTHSRGIIKAGQDQAQMTLTAPREALLGTLGLKVLGYASGKAENKDARIEREAEPAEEMMQAFSYQHLIPASDFLTTVETALPITLSSSIKSDSILKIVQDGTINITLDVNRQEGFEVPVQLVLSNPTSGIKMKPVLVAGNEKHGTVTIETQNIQPGKEITLIISGVTRPGKNAKIKTMTVLCPALSAIIVSK
ncbi:MAG: PPC domain-containing protein [Bacteroidota bacterium]|nr:PPC domain-containing protein [Bacteroidota bacterium]